MNQNDFPQISPAFFLQTFILELMHVCEQAGGNYCESVIDQIAKSAGQYFEQTYRDEYHRVDELGRENYMGWPQNSEKIVR